jgi:GrpB-like predicted nucleotidyltransferase (UPF0157 family)
MPCKDESKRMNSMTEQRLHDVTVCDRCPLNDVIHIVPFNPEWKSIYTFEAKRIQDALRSSVQLLEHVGSISDPGLSAKPIIDMVMATTQPWLL